MEVRLGYKQTEVGLIPRHWEVKPLRLISPKQSVGLVINPSTYFNKAGTVPLLVGSHVRENHIDATTANRITHESNKALSASRLSAGDLVTVRVGDPGVTAVVPPELDGCNCASMMIIRSHPSFDSRWLCAAMNSWLGRRQVQGVQYGTAQKQFNISDAVDFKFAVPPLFEQRAIAETLSDVDTLLGGLDRLIAKKRELKHAAMQQLLTGQTRLPGFRGEWEVKRLGDVIMYCQSGATPRRNRPEFYKGDIRWITSGELNYNVITDTIEKISTEAVVETNLAIYPVGTFLMAITGLEAEGTRGACGIVGAPSTTNQSCMAIFPSPALVSEYLFHYYVFRGKSLALQYCQGTKQQSYTASLVKQLPIELPPTVAEQTAIAVLLSNLDGELAAIDTRRNKTRDVKRAMMQELLTGRTRLVSPEPAHA